MTEASSVMDFAPKRLLDDELTAFQQIASSLHLEPAHACALAEVRLPLKPRTAGVNSIPDLSWIEMTKLIPSLLQRFDIELANSSQEPKQHCW